MFFTWKSRLINILLLYFNLTAFKNFHSKKIFMGQSSSSEHQQEIPQEKLSEIEIEYFKSFTRYFCSNK